MDPQSFNERSFGALRRHGVSLSEHFVMCSVRLPYSPSQLAAHARSSAEGDPRGEFTLAEYSQAVNRCLEKGWLTIVTPEHFRAEQQRIHDSNIPEILDRDYQPGHVDFTPAGYAIHRAVIQQTFGEAHLQQSDAGYNFEPAFCRFSVFAPTRELCSEVMQRLREGEWEACLDGPAELERTSGPEPIGEWRPCRFISLPSGFCGTMHFRSLAVPPGEGREAAPHHPESVK